jgi:hypothetical protein
MPGCCPSTCTFRHMAFHRPLVGVEVHERERTIGALDTELRRRRQDQPWHVGGSMFFAFFELSQSRISSYMLTGRGTLPRR